MNPYEQQTAAPMRGPKSIQLLVLPLADGTRSIAEIAQLLGVSYRRVQWALAALRANGHRAPILPMPIGRLDRHAVADCISRGDSYSEIGQRLGISRQAVHSFVKRRMRNQ